MAFHAFPSKHRHEVRCHLLHAPVVPQKKSTAPKHTAKTAEIARVGYFGGFGGVIWASHLMKSQARADLQAADTISCHVASPVPSAKKNSSLKKYCQNRQNLPQGGAGHFAV